MPNLKKVKPKNRSQIAWVTGILCAACCAVPFVGIFTGSAALAALTAYSEAAAIAMAAFIVAWLVYRHFSSKKAPACDLECGCRPTPTKNTESKTD